MFRSLSGSRSADRAPEALGRSLLAGYIKDQLDHQSARKVSLEQRGAAVVTTSAALVTLLFGLAALSTQAKQTFSLSHGARWLLVVALVLFFAAAVTAIMTNAPMRYRGPTVAGLRRAVHSEWDSLEGDVLRNAALTNLKLLEDAQIKNQKKGIFLFWAMVFQVIAVAFVAAAIGIVVSGVALAVVGSTSLLLAAVAYLKRFGLHRPGGILGETLKEVFGRASPNAR